MAVLKWFEAVVPVGLEVRQVYGFIFSMDGRILVLEDEGKFNLPGGKPEDSESVSQTLARESLEEGQVIIGTADYLGYQCVEDEEHFAQVRLVASIEHFLPSDKDPSTGRQYQRLLAPPIELNELLRWEESGNQQVVSAIAAASKFGVSWDGTPHAYI